MDSITFIGGRFNDQEIAVAQLDRMEALVVIQGHTYMVRADGTARFLENAQELVLVEREPTDLERCIPDYDPNETFD